MLYDYLGIQCLKSKTSLFFIRLNITFYEYISVKAKRVYDWESSRTTAHPVTCTCDAVLTIVSKYICYFLRSKKCMYMRLVKFHLKLTDGRWKMIQDIFRCSISSIHPMGRQHSPSHAVPNTCEEIKDWEL